MWQINRFAYFRHKYYYFGMIIYERNMYLCALALIRKKFYKNLCQIWRSKTNANCFLVLHTYGVPSRILITFVCTREALYLHYVCTLYVIYSNLTPSHSKQ